jgi:hypothetical protein
MSLGTVLFVVMWLPIFGLTRGGWAESAGVNTQTWLRASDMRHDDKISWAGPLTRKRDLTLPVLGREDIREDRSDTPVGCGGLPRKLTALDQDVIELTGLAERRRWIDDQGRLVWDWGQAIDQQWTDRAAELRLLEGVDAFYAGVRGPMEAASLTTRSSRMELERQEYKGHRIELRARGADELRAREGEPVNEP